jgi:transposase-like protein
VRRAKRTYSPDTKAALLAACRAPGASIAAVASAHGMNANVLHRWLKESSQSNACPAGTFVEMAERGMPAFIPVPLLTQAGEPMERTIKVDIRKASLAMTVTWPLSAASEFACWSASVLK